MVHVMSISFMKFLIQFHLTGIPVTWMLLSSGIEATIKKFLNFIKMHNLEVMPVIIMSDHNKAQMNAINTVYPDSKLLLCWWHMLHTIQMHFHTEEFPEVWECVCEWVKTSDQSKFDSLWEWIQTDPSVPQSLVDYLKTNWMTIVPLWSGTMRQQRTIF